MNGWLLSFCSDKWSPETMESNLRTIAQYIEGSTPLTDWLKGSFSSGEEKEAL
jgi:hypothetical protein